MFLKEIAVIYTPKQERKSSANLASLLNDEQLIF